jgi:hypothetical protein
MSHRITPLKVGVYRHPEGWSWICAQCGFDARGANWTEKDSAEAHYRGHVTVRKECRALFPYQFRGTCK